MSDATPPTAPPKPRPVAIFDSGVGGLTVLREIERALPATPLVYLGDTARVPYGTRAPETVVRYAREAARFVRQLDAQLLIVACNTVSSVAMPAIAEEGVRAIGVLEPGAAAAAARSRSGRIGVIGTRATIGSGAYERAIRARRPDATLTVAACPLFVPLAEEGWADHAVASQIAAEYLQPLRDADVDTVVLGCTHYPLLRATLGDVLGDGVTLVDSASVIAEEAAELVVSSASAEARRERFFVTDDPSPFEAVAERFLGRSISGVEQVRLDD